MQKFFKWHAPTILWGVLILFLTLYPFEEGPSRDIPFLDKIAHMGLFGMFTILLTRSFLKDLEFSNILLLISFLFGASLGLFIELVQNAVPNRNFEWMDWLADMIGSIFGIVAFKILNMKSWRVFE